MLEEPAFGAPSIIFWTAGIKIPKRLPFTIEKLPTPFRIRDGEIFFKADAVEAKMGVGGFD